MVERIELSGTTPSAASAAGDDAASPVWLDWLAQTGTEIAMPLTSAIDGVRRIASTGRLEPAEAGRLLDDLGRARRAAIVAQQLVRVATGQARHVPERLDLAAVLRAAVAECGADGRTALLTTFAGRLPALAVEADPALVGQLVQTALDWAHEHAKPPVHLALDVVGVARPRLDLRFRPGTPLRVVDRHDAPRAAMDTLAWRLLVQLAALLRTSVDRTLDADGCLLRLEFPPAQAAPAAPARRRTSSTKAAPKPLAGHHVLIVTACRDLRRDVQHAMRHLGLMIDAVASLDEARVFCREGMPHAIVADARVGDQALLSLRRELLADAPGLAAIEVGGHHEGWHTSIDDPAQLARVGRSSLADGLPAALMFELTRDA